MPSDIDASVYFLISELIFLLFLKYIYACIERILLL